MLTWISSQTKIALLRRIYGAFIRRVRKYSLRLRDFIYTTYLKKQGDVLRPLLGNEPLFPEISISHEQQKCVEHFCIHEFDLLGSGWTQIHHGVKAKGIEGFQYHHNIEPINFINSQWLKGRINQANLRHSQYIWSLIGKSSYAHPLYIPIDWQLDFKSGFRWSENQHFTNVPYGHKLGVDIKIPWELSRLQHLPQLAIYACTNRGKNNEQSEKVIQEIRAQLIDFIALNPPRFGVNWRCPMDISIRLVNMIVTSAILNSYGTHFDDEFQTIFTHTIQSHVDHVLAHLEWSENARGNHYFANVLGLLFASATLPHSPKNDTLRAFATQEFFIESRRQFLKDGTTFEGSTGYHRLSAEMLYWGTALILGFDERSVAGLSNYNHQVISVRPPFKAGPNAHFKIIDGKIEIPPFLIDTIKRSAQFILNTTLPDGHCVKIGDYDSGRLLKIAPPLITQNNPEVCEDTLNHFDAVNLSNALFGEGEGAEMIVLSHLARSRILSPYSLRIKPLDIKLNAKRQQGYDQKEMVIPLTHINLDKIVHVAYPEFGLFIWRSDEFYFGLRCHTGDGHREWGHFHDDNLSIELYVKNNHFIRDPGTFLYTAMPEIRKLYRSPHVHFVPRLDGCPAMAFGPSLFEGKPIALGQCLEFSKYSFLGSLKGQNWEVQREIKINSNELRITDISLHPFKKLHQHNFQTNFFDTDGYGKQSKRFIYSI